MSKSRKLKLHIDHIGEIRTILNSMKNLAFTETHKLSRFLTAQSSSVSNIEMAGSDFLNFYSFSPSPKIKESQIVILVGSERGFCGDFNERLIDALTQENYSGIIALGNRLCSRLPDQMANNVVKLPGVSIAEEVPTMLDRLMATIGALPTQYGVFKLAVIYHDDAEKRIVRRQLLPPFQQRPEKLSRQGTPPILNLVPKRFYSELIDQYLLAVLHNILYLSLMAENQQRLIHLDSAVKRLDDETARLQRKSQIYRQEEITEEIEVILLNAEGP